MEQKKKRINTKEWSYQQRQKGMTREELVEEISLLRHSYNKIYLCAVIFIYLGLILAAIAYISYDNWNTSTENAEQYKSLLIKMGENICEQTSDQSQHITIYQDPLAIVCEDAILIEEAD